MSDMTPPSRLPNKLLVSAISALTLLLVAVAKNLETASDVKEIVFDLKQKTDSLSLSQASIADDVRRLRYSDSTLALIVHCTKSNVDSILLRSKIEAEVEKKFRVQLSRYTAQKDVAYAEKVDE